MIRTSLILFSFITLLLLASAWWLWQEKERQIHSEINLEEKFHYTIKNGKSLKSVLRDLTNLGLIENPNYLLFEAKQNNKAHLIKAGEYEIEPRTTQLQLLELFIVGKVIQYSITLIEGWNFKQVMQAIEKNAYLEQTLVDKTKDEIMAALEHPDIHPEGQFFPDTYLFPTGTQDVDLLRRANKRLHQVLDEEWHKRDEQIPLPYKNAYQALTMASIIEKETGAAEERAIIAGVFVRRLNINMKLQTDPTVIYSLGEAFDGNLRRKDLRYDSPYNTYVYKGLPPTPIALAGREAIHAALHPEAGESLYFVAKGNGRHYFSKTLAEHNRAIRKYILKK